MDADAARLYGRIERRLRDGNVDGEPDGGVGGADGGAWTFRARERCRWRWRLADGLYIEGRARLRFQGDGSRGLRHRRAAKSAVRSLASRRCGSNARADQTGSRDRLAAFPRGRFG